MAKLLLDQNLSFKLCARLADIFPDTSQARLLGLDRASDADLWTYARENEFVLVSFDADFADLATLHGLPPKVVWLRFGNSSTAFIERELRGRTDTILAFCADEDAACLELG